MSKYVDTTPVIEWLDDGIRDKAVSNDTREAYRRIAATIILDIPSAKVRPDLTAEIVARPIRGIGQNVQTVLYYCGNCRKTIQLVDNFCSCCGARLVKGGQE